MEELIERLQQYKYDYDQGELELSYQMVCDCKVAAEAIQSKKDIDDLLKEYLSDYSDSFHEEIKNGIYASVFPMKKEIFLCGFRTAIGLMLDCKMYE